VSTTHEPADHRDERPETEGPLTEVGQVNRASTAPAPVARLVDSNGLQRASTWTTLGTMGGPIASSHRAQPANLLMQHGFGALLVDSGDGAADQLAKVGVNLAKVGAVILSHLHIDHTAGLHGILGRRLQQRIPGELRIYGPPGTRQVVEQITASQTYVDDLMKTDFAAGSLAPATVTVTEITEGSIVTAGGATVTATTNSHYGFHNGTAEAARFQSLSYRFDLPVAAIAYVDPGNFATNFSAGAAFAYSLAWVVLAANLVAMLVQYLSAKIGVATGKDLPELCREQLPRAVSRGLWVQAELVAMATDMAEFIGAAIGLNLLFRTPLLIAGLITAVAAFAILALEQRGYRRFELAIIGLLGIVLLGFAYDLAAVHPSGAGMASGLVPGLGGPAYLLLAVGIIGATVMPHVVYLHSALTKSRVPCRDDGERRELLRFQRLDVLIALGAAGLCATTTPKWWAYKAKVGCRRV
jgi:hypothetical protein